MHSETKAGSSWLGTSKTRFNSSAERRRSARFNSSATSPENVEGPSIMEKDGDVTSAAPLARNSPIASLYLFNSAHARISSTSWSSLPACASMATLTVVGILASKSFFALAKLASSEFIDSAFCLEVCFETLIAFNLV
jgi:hypothetical protein